MRGPNCVILVNREFLPLWVAVDDQRGIRMRLVGEPEIEAFLKQLCPRVRETRSEKNDVCILEVSHVQLARIAHDELTFVCLGETGKPHRRIQICNIRVTLRVQDRKSTRLNSSHVKS